MDNSENNYEFISHKQDDFLVLAIKIINEICQEEYFEFGNDEKHVMIKMVFEQLNKFDQMLPDNINIPCDYYKKYIKKALVPSMIEIKKMQSIIN